MLRIREMRGDTGIAGHELSRTEIGAGRIEARPPPLCTEIRGVMGMLSLNRLMLKQERRRRRHRRRIQARSYSSLLHKYPLYLFS
jgi:hypothetical protein